jgi:hypothetical protein
MRPIRSRMPPRRQRLWEDLQRRTSSPAPLRCSRRCGADCAKHVGVAPAPLGPAPVRTSQRLLGAETHGAWPSVVPTVCAWRVFSRVPLRRPGRLASIAPPRQPFTRPTMRRQADVAAGRTAAPNLQPRALLTTLAAAGLRGAARCRWPVTASDRPRLLRRVRHGPGQHARDVMLAPTRLPVVRQSGPQAPPRPGRFPGPPRPRPGPPRPCIESAGRPERRRTSRRGSSRPCGATPLRPISSQRGWRGGGAHGGWAIAACARPVAPSMAPRLLSTRPRAPWRRGPWPPPAAPSA